MQPDQPPRERLDLFKKVNLSRLQWQPHATFDDALFKVREYAEVALPGPDNYQLRVEHGVQTKGGEYYELTVQQGTETVLHITHTAYPNGQELSAFDVVQKVSASPISGRALVEKLLDFVPEVARRQTLPYRHRFNRQNLSFLDSAEGISLEQWERAFKVPLEDHGYRERQPGDWERVYNQ